MIVSLDLEYNSNPAQIYQIGLSVLDTRHLASIDIEDLQSLTPWVSSHLFLLQKRRRFRVYCYGDPLYVENICLEEILRPFLAIEDETGHFRNVVLVGHSINVDLSILDKCGLDLDSLTYVRAYIDIAPTCSHFFGDGIHHLSLKKICQYLRIRTFSYHNAAHDALYTLQVLLKLFCLYEEKKLASPYNILSMPPDDNDRRELWECQLEILRYIGKELGNVLWVGSPGNRRRRQQRENYLRHLRPGISLEAVELIRTNRKEEPSILDTLSIGDAFTNRLQEVPSLLVDWLTEGWLLEAPD